MSDIGFRLYVTGMITLIGLMVVGTASPYKSWMYNHVPLFLVGFVLLGLTGLLAALWMAP